MTPRIRRRTEGRRTIFDLDVDDSAVSHVVVHDLEMWIQGVRVRAGGVGGVSTVSEHRGRGYAATLLKEAIGFMRSEGTLVSLLFGIPDYYDRFGYAPFMAFWSITVGLADALRTLGETRPPLVRRAVEDDYAPILDWYNDLARLRSASMARDTGSFRRFAWGTYRDGRGLAYVARDTPGGAPWAYVVCREESVRFSVIEVACPDPARYPSLLAALVTLAREHGGEDVTLEIPADDPFARYLLACGCVVQTRYPRMSDGMLKILDVPGLMGCLREPLERRLERSVHRAARLELTVEDEQGAASVRIGPDTGSPVSVAEPVGPRTFSQLVTGYRAAGDLVGPGRAADVLATIFEARSPYVWQADRF